MSCVGFSAYAITHRDSGRVYIGITTRCITNRYKAHLSSARCGSVMPIHRAIREHGADSFSLEKLADAVDWISLCALERQLIEQYRALDPAYGYNAHSMVTVRGGRPREACRCTRAPMNAPKTLPMLARALVDARHKSGMSQTEAAIVAGVTCYHVSRIERGVSKPRSGTTAALARAYGISLDQLLGCSI